MAENMNPHTNLIQALTEFYSIFVQLAVVEPSFLTFPDSSTAAENFNAAAALEAGFSPEVVALLPQLPYLHVNNGEGALEIMSSTDPVTYLGKDFNGDSFNVGDFESLRSLDIEGMADVDIPSHSFRLSVQNIYGVTLIYNTQTCKFFFSAPTCPIVHGSNASSQSMSFSPLTPCRPYDRMGFV